MTWPAMPRHPNTEPSLARAGEGSSRIPETHSHTVKRTAFESPVVKLAAGSRIQHCA